MAAKIDSKGVNEILVARVIPLREEACWLIEDE
jgi:hypothetical protein